MINIDLTKEKGLEISFTGQVIGADGSVVDKKINDAKNEITQQISNDYYKKPVVDKKINEVRASIPSLESYATREYVDRSIEDKSLSLDGGTMKGNIDMNGKRIDNIGIEEVNSLPTTNLYEGRMVRFKNKTYTLYNGLWLALSDDLRGHANDTHEENFVYQPTASDLSVKDGFADIKKLKGNTVVWNQLIKSIESTTKNGITFTNNNDGSYTVNGTATADAQIVLYSLQINRNAAKYLLKGCPAGGSNDTYYFGGSNIWTASTNKIDTGSGVVVNDNTSLEYTDSISIIIKSGYTANNLIFKPQLFNLTQMFGEGNEPATVKEFETMFSNDYYEYSEGELLSFDGKGLKSVGFNQWDEEWEVGGLHQKTGEPISSTGIRSKNFNRCIGNTTYYIKGNTRIDVYWYDVNKNYISFNKMAINSLRTSPKQAAWFKLRIGLDTDITTYNNDICINLSHSGYRDGEYEPYEDYKLSFQDGNTISQLTGKLNGEGESVVIFPEGLKSAGTAYDEIAYDEVTGKHKAIKRIDSVDMGSLITSTTVINNVVCWVKLPKHKFRTSRDAHPNILCDKYLTSKVYDLSKVDKVVSTAIPTATYVGYLVISDSSYTDAALLKQSLAGQILYYELAEPEVYELDNPINTGYEAYDFGTEEVLYNDGNEVNIPMKASIEYGFNAVDMIRNNFEEIRSLKERVTALEQAILQIQAANTSTETPIEP